jgi:hypothetical protein
MKNSQKLIFRLKLVIFFFFTITFLDSCRSSRVSSEAPEQVFAIPVFQPKLSDLNVPITFRIKELENMVNQELGNILYNDENIDDDNVQVKVSKTDRINIRAENNLIYFTLPLNIWAKGKWEWQACDICPKLSKSESTQFDIKINANTLLSLTEDWKVKTKTKGAYEWGNTKPSIEIGPLKINLTKILNPVLDRVMDKAMARFDQEIQQRIKIKEMVRKAWVDIQQPIQLDKNLDAWLRIDPKEVRLSNITTRNDEVNVKVGIRSYIETVTGGKPQVQVSKNLPNLILDSKMKDEFLVNIAAEMPYTQATNLMKQEFAGKDFSFDNGKYKLKVNDVEISGSGSKLIMKLDVNGNAKKGFMKKKFAGTLYLQGIPYYDAATSSIKVHDFDFNLKSKDALLKAASWVTKVGFAETIKEKIQFPLKDKIDEAKKMVQNGLDKNGRINNNVLLQGSITNIQPDNIYLTPNGIKAVVNGAGKVTVLIDKL